MSDLPKEAKHILKAAVSKSNPHGTVMYQLPLNGVITIGTRHETLISGKGRDIAAWVSALEKLVEQGLLLEKINERKINERMFEVTPKGREYAE